MQSRLASTRCAILPLLVGLAALNQCSAIAATGIHRVAISPSLDPESHKEFFNEEYPKDFQPSPQGVHKEFHYPYPIVQDSGEYDKDYVKDENDDGGEWSAQMHYDMLRGKIQKQRDDAAETAKAAAEAKEKYDAAKAEADAAHSDTETASQEAADASKAEDETEEKLKILIGKDAVDARDGNATSGTDGNATSGQNADGEAGGAAGSSEVNGTDGSEGSDESEIGGEVGEGVKKVEVNVEGLKDCQEQLAAARQKLKEAMEEKETREKARADAKAAAEQEAAEEAAAEAAAASMDAKEAAEARAKARAAHRAKMSDIEKQDADELESAQAKADAARATVEELEKRLKEEEDTFKEADDAYKKDTEAVETSEADIAKAADRLRKFRKADSDGGVYSTHRRKSAAVAPRASVALLLVGCAFTSLM